MKFTFLALALCACLVVPVLSHAQTKSEILTNAGIVKLFKAGLDEEIIQSKIGSSNCKFDLSGDGLIALKTAGVPPGVIKSMMNRMDPPAAAATMVAVSEKPGKPVAAAGIPEPEMINAVYFYDKSSHVAKPLEKQSATMKSQMKMLGYGGTNLIFQVPGAASTARFSQDQVESFLINTGTGPADIFVLYKVETKKNTRQAIGASYQLTGFKGSKGVIATDLKMARTGVYELIPSTKLARGEYFFALKSATNAITSSADVYAFAID